VVLLLSGCLGTVVSETFTTVGEPAPAPAVGEPSGAGNVPVIVYATGASAGGPGISIEDAIAGASGVPVLVNGALMLDAQGDLWLCDAVEVLESEDEAPVCVEPRLAVVNYPDGTAEFDPANASATGLQVVGDISWIPNAQVFGEVRP
jgi:hypothetical protein